MAEGLALRDSAECLAPHRQCVVVAGAAAVRHHGADAMNLYANDDFIFNCPLPFIDRFDGKQDYFKPKDDLRPIRCVASPCAAPIIVPDIVQCELPLDNRRSPGYRRIEPHMARQPLLHVDRPARDRPLFQSAQTWLRGGARSASRARAIPTLGRRTLGTQPWSNGKADKVFRVDYEPVGMVSAAPMSGDWFHQHFGISKESLRLTAWFGANNSRSRKPGRPGEAQKDLGAIDIRDGGSAIPYDEEDPYIRKEYEATLAKEGAVSRMEGWLYEKPKPGESRPMADFVGI